MEKWSTQLSEITGERCYDEPHMATNRFLIKVKLTNKIVHNQKYLQCTFALLQPFCAPFKSGQYVSFKIGEPPQLRSYSVCGIAPDQSSFDLLIDVTPQGLGSTFLQKLEVGTEVEALCPLGKFTLDEQQVNLPAVLVGTGSGIAPLRCMIMDLLHQRQTTQPVTLLWGERFAADLIWQDELRGLTQQYPNFKFIPTVSKPTDQDGAYQSGRVTNVIETMELLPGAIYYLCGNKDMIADAARILGERGVGESAIRYEKFD